MKSPGRGRTLFWIISAVVAVHIAFFCLIANRSPLPKTEYIPPPNFIAKEAAYTDGQTGEKMVYREFTVSTRLEKREETSTPPVMTGPVAVP